MPAVPKPANAAPSANATPPADPTPRPCPVCGRASCYHCRTCRKDLSCQSHGTGCPADPNGGPLCRATDPGITFEERVRLWLRCRDAVVAACGGEWHEGADCAMGHTVCPACGGAGERGLWYYRAGFDGRINVRCRSGGCRVAWMETSGGGRTEEPVPDRPLPPRPAATGPRLTPARPKPARAGRKA